MSDRDPRRDVRSVLCRATLPVVSPLPSVFSPFFAFPSFNLGTGIIMTIRIRCISIHGSPGALTRIQEEERRINFKRKQERVCRLCGTRENVHEQRRRRKRDSERVWQEIEQLNATWIFSCKKEVAAPGDDLIFFFLLNTLSPTHP